MSFILLLCQQAQLSSDLSYTYRMGPAKCLVSAGDVGIGKSPCQTRLHSAWGVRSSPLPCEQASSAQIESSLCFSQLPNAVCFGVTCPGFRECGYCNTSPHHSKQRQLNSSVTREEESPGHNSTSNCKPSYAHFLIPDTLLSPQCSWGVFHWTGTSIRYALMWVCLDPVSGRQILERGVMPPGEDGRCLPWKTWVGFNLIVLCWGDTTTHTKLSYLESPWLTAPNTGLWAQNEEYIGSHIWALSIVLWGNVD